MLHFKQSLTYNDNLAKASRKDIVSINAIQYFVGQLFVCKKHAKVRTYLISGIFLSMTKWYHLSSS